MSVPLFGCMALGIDCPSFAAVRRGYYVENVILAQLNKACICYKIIISFVPKGKLVNLPSHCEYPVDKED